MKSIGLLFALFLCCATVSTAQIFQGQKILGGTVSFQSSKADKDGADAVTTIELQPNFLYFVGKQFALGASAGLSRQSSNGYSQTAISIAPEGRYYFGDLNKIPFFLTAGFGLISFNVDYDGQFGDGSQTGYFFGFGPGINIFLYKHVALEGILAYQRVAFDDYSQNDFGLRFGVSAFG